MALDIIARGIGASAVRVSYGYEFASDAERDAYFNANPNELVENMYIIVADILQQRQGNIWIDVTPIIKGPQGDTGEQGPEGKQGVKGDQGETGATGVGISKIELISTVGLIDTYQITYTNGATYNYEITNGQDGGGGGTSDHSKLTNRYIINQHNIASIEGLTEALADLANKVTQVYRPKGSKNTYEDLPTTGNEVGDVWDILTGEYAGQNFAWTENEAWDSLSGIVNLSAYSTTAEVESMIQEVENSIPTELPNPNALTFTGLATGSYDGAIAKNINIALSAPTETAFGGIKASAKTAEDTVPIKVDPVTGVGYVKPSGGTIVTVDGEEVATWNADLKMDVNQQAQPVENLYIDGTTVLKTTPPTETDTYALSTTPTVFTYSAPNDGSVLRNTSYQFNSTFVFDNNGADYYDVGITWKIRDEIIATFSDRNELGRRELRDYLSAPVINRLINKDIAYSAGDVFSLEITGSVSAGSISIETSAESPIQFVRNGPLSLSTNEVFGIDKEGKSASQAQINAELREDKEDVSTSVTFTSAQVASGVALGENVDIAVTGEVNNFVISSAGEYGAIQFVAGSAVAFTFPADTDWLKSDPNEDDPVFTQGVLYTVAWYKGGFKVIGGR